jgi:hypothetical protein
VHSVGNAIEYNTIEKKKIPFEVVFFVLPAIIEIFGKKRQRTALFPFLTQSAMLCACVSAVRGDVWQVLADVSNEESRIGNEVRPSGLGFERTAGNIPLQ